MTSSPAPTVTRLRRRVEKAPVYSVRPRIEAICSHSDAFQGVYNGAGEKIEPSYAAWKQGFIQHNQSHTALQKPLLAALNRIKGLHAKKQKPAETDLSRKAHPTPPTTTSFIMSSGSPASTCDARAILEHGATGSGGSSLSEPGIRSPRQRRS